MRPGMLAALARGDLILSGGGMSAVPDRAGRAGARQALRGVAAE